MAFMAEAKTVMAFMAMVALIGASDVAAQSTDCKTGEGPALPTTPFFPLTPGKAPILPGTPFFPLTPGKSPVLPGTPFFPLTPGKAPVLLSRRLVSKHHIIPSMAATPAVADTPAVAATPFSPLPALAPYFKRPYFPRTPFFPETPAHHSITYPYERTWWALVLMKIQLKEIVEMV
ncbi:hypothetical protein SUGI_0685440 [Cryptomeria japonica]|nr:hypothetical protein SUGI_0685440 [Cryptomeria japonica]